ncbi:MAG: hypothetical protein GXC72_00900 [Chitinophagaceae bacterium]|nr:hypothetical protein [Chitinophagaceae bacterium]
MEHNTQYNIAAAAGGAIAAAGNNLVNLIQAPVRYTYAIDWAETFQIGWKAAVGALVGLGVKWIWDKIFNRKKRKK